MKVKLYNILEGKEESMGDYTSRLQETINIALAEQTEKELPLFLHQTAASDGRLHTTIQINIYD